MASSVDCKVVLLGSASVGKTCLLQRYIHGYYQENTQATIAGSFAAKRENAGSIQVVLGCWDTAGSERYASLSRMYYRNAKAAVVCFDPTSRSTYESARHWVSELKSQEEECKIYLCSTKKDYVDGHSQLRTVSRLEAKDLASDLQADYFETSGKSGQNVEAMFRKIAKDFAVSEDSICKKFGDFESIKLSWKKDHRILKEKSKSCCNR